MLGLLSVFSCARPETDPLGMNSTLVCSVCRNTGSSYVVRVPSGCVKDPKCIVLSLMLSLLHCTVKFSVAKGSWGGSDDVKGSGR